MEGNSHLAAPAVWNEDAALLSAPTPKAVRLINSRREGKLFIIKTTPLQKMFCYSETNVGVIGLSQALDP